MVQKQGSLTYLQLGHQTESTVDACGTLDERVSEEDDLRVRRLASRLTLALTETHFLLVNFPIPPLLSLYHTLTQASQKNQEILGSYF